uniref:SMB domain-containing protein n=2 Tax=Phaeomonas parva TaxID=124430 RepID=A0A7S1UCE9_9STRA|mmetsp:Transcript_40984/g.128486  ORF Transcript_40984/g.128486 Transcript_40984/m.128486 type:complete len:467 (+) Transcript_40984:202-1602(+)
MAFNFFKLAILSALAAPAMASLRGGRRLRVDDVGTVSSNAIQTCKAAYDAFLAPKFAAQDGVNAYYNTSDIDVNEATGCVAWPTVYRPDGKAWRSSDARNTCYCDNYCDANDDCCVDFCTKCNEFPAADPTDITNFEVDAVDVTGADPADIPSLFEGVSSQIPWPKVEQTSGDPLEFAFPLAPLCEIGGICDVDVPVVTFDDAFPYIQYAASAGRFDGGDWSDDGRPLQWLMSVEAVDINTVLPWKDSDFSIADDDVECDGTPLVSGSDTATDLRYVYSCDPCDWIPYIGNGWSELPKCVVDPPNGRHRANARHLKAIDMGMQVNQDCCRDCAPDNAVQYARTTMILDETAHPTGWAGVIKFVGNDAAVIWKDGVRVYQEEVCSAATSGLAVEIPFYLAPGKNVIVVKARNHGQEMKEKNQGFFMKFPLNIIDDIIISIEKPEGAPPAPDVPGGIGGGLNRSRREL